ncbi:hypothetical protein ACNOYE_34085 [Nannocystaceae bacterium ST9]
MTRMIPSFALAGLLGALASSAACDIPECIDGPSNLTPEATASCEAPLDPAESEILSAGAEWLDDGSLVITWTSWGLECGIRSDDVEPSDDCNRTGWIISAKIPAELAILGTLDLATHPEIRSGITVIHGGDAGSRGTIGDEPDEPFLVGTIELTQLDEGCVAGVLHSFGTGDPDPTLGGPELEGSFVAPTC